MDFTFFAVTTSVVLCTATNISLSNFLLDLKAAFSKLAHIRVQEFLCFLYFSQVSNAFPKDRILFMHLVNG